MTRILVLTKGMMGLLIALACVGEARAACTVHYVISNDWGSGAITSMTVDNAGPTAINGWSLTWSFPGSQVISNLWSGTFTQTGAAVSVSNETWNGNIGIGGSISFGFETTYSGSNPAPTAFSLNGVACAVDTTVPPTATPGPQSTPTATAPSGPLPPSTASWPSRVFAPFVDATAYPAFPLVDVAVAENVKFYALGFVVAASNNSCVPSWGTYYSIDSYLASDIAALRAVGGDVVVSFGGAANTELAVACSTVGSLKQSYQAVIDRYGLTHIDFDIEGAWVADHASIDRRSTAIAGLQADAQSAGRELKVWFTLPVLPSGLTADGLYVLQSALNAGVEIDLVNLMAMDYGDSAAPQPSGKMAEYAMQAGASLVSQLRTLYQAHGASLSDAELWKLVGLTPMIGVNDVTTEIFDLVDAVELRDFAVAQEIGAVSMWSANRDQQCPGGVQPYASISCSSILQSPFQFSQIFLGASLAPPDVTPTPTSASGSPTATLTPAPAETCAATPRSGCDAADSGSLAIRVSSTARRNHFDLRWKGAGTASFGEPTSSDSYAVCVYDTDGGIPRLAWNASLASGGSCGARECWRSSGTGFRYGDRAAVNGGITAVKLTHSASGRTSLSFKGGGANLTAPVAASPTALFADDPSVVAQIVRSGGKDCWELALPAPSRRSDAESFSARR